MPIDANLIAGISGQYAAGQQRGIQNALVARELEQDLGMRNALAAYLEAPPDQRGPMLNALVAQDPRVAANVLSVQQAEAAAGREEATRWLQTAQYGLRRAAEGAKPADLLRILDSSGEMTDFVRQARAQHDLDGDGDIDDDEALALFRDMESYYGPLAGTGPADSGRADPAAIREMQALGFPMTPEGFAEYNAAKGTEGGAGATLAAIQAQLAIDTRREQLERDRRADAEAAEKRERERAQLRSTVRRSIDQTGKIAELTEKLEGSFLEAGMPASSWRRTGAGLLAGAGAAVGLDTSKLRKDLDAYDQLKKNMSDQLINLMSTGGLGEATNSKLEQYQNALASTETSPGAIMAIQANIAEILLDEADANGFDVPNRRRVEANIEKWRGYDSPPDDPVVDLPAIAKMTRAQLDELVANAANLSAEVLEAAARRWDELNAAR